MKEKRLDQWFTKDDIAEWCVRLMGIRKSDKVIEPSCGSGSFVQHLHNVSYYDLDPQIEGCIEGDWLEQEGLDADVIIGNPPYGSKGKLAVDFINKSLEFTDRVGFIVPLTLSSSWTAQHHVREDASLVFEVPIPRNSFTFMEKSVDVPSVFQIWEKNCNKINLRLKRPETTHKDLDIRIYNKTKNAEKWLDWDWDIAVKRNSKKGEYILKKEDGMKEYHWILIKGPTRNLKKIDWSTANDNKMTAGIGKADVIKLYEEVLNDNT